MLIEIKPQEQSSISLEMQIFFMLLCDKYLLSGIHRKSSIIANKLLLLKALRQPQKNILSLEY